MPRKEPAKTPTKRARATGQGALLSGGVPGNKGGRGRPTNEFRDAMAELLDDELTKAYLKACLTGEHGAQVFLKAFEFATDRAYGKAPQPITGADGGRLEIVIRDE